MRTSSKDYHIFRNLRLTQAKSKNDIAESSITMGFHNHENDLDLPGESSSQVKSDDGDLLFCVDCEFIIISWVCLVLLCRYIKTFQNG